MYDDEEEYSSAVGTAFPPLEADEIVSRKPEIDQTVRDERGRRRFHGAFTGGFSAGYWNTVGSAEGFTPQIFSSSRVNKADRAASKGARPEDFMDDEDLGSFGIAPKRIHTKEDFAENFAGLRDTSYSLYDVIKSVLEPSKQSIGMRLFTRMKRHVKMAQKLSRQSSKHKAKESSPHLLQVESKGDLHGLGYNGALDPDNYLYGEQSKGTLVKAEAVSATLGGGRRLKISGEAFGYGALEEEDDYMMGGSVYGTDDMSQYDFALGGPTKKAKDKWKKRTDGVPYGTLAGNSLQLEGFEKAAQRSSLFAEMRRHYRPPEVPSNWRPKKKRRRRAGAGLEEPKKSRWGAKVEESTSANNELASKTPQQQPTLNANLRAVILGEEVIVHRMGIEKKESLVQELPPSTTVSVPQKPLSGFFASRFTRGSSALDDPAISAGLSTFKDLSSTPAFGSQQKGEAEIAEESSKPPTRTTYQWHPAKLVCRRFGLQHPFPQFPDIVGIVSVDRSGQKTRNMTSKLQTVQQAAGQANSSSRTLFAGLFGNLDGMATFSPAVTKVERPNLPTPIKSTTVIEKIASEEEEDEEDTEEQQPPRPPVDLFKSIFASDEEEEEEEDSAKSATASKDEASNGVESGSGIFAGVDFAQLNQNFNPCLKEKPAEPVAVSVASSQLDDDCYGPALPPPSSKIAAISQSLNISSSSGKSSRRHKDKKSKKGKKSKSKKHHRRRRSSSSDSETSLPEAKRHRKSHSEIDSQILELINEGRRHN